MAARKPSSSDQPASGKKKASSTEKKSSASSAAKPAAEKTSSAPKEKKSSSSAKKASSAPRKKKSSKAKKQAAGLLALLAAIVYAIVQFATTGRVDLDALFGSTRSTTSQPSTTERVPAGDGWEGEHLPWGAPVAQHGPEGSRLVREGYVLSHDNARQIAQWVAYRLDAEDHVGQMARSERFFPDPDLAGNVAEDDDYRGSGYDRGHMAPAADMRKSRRVQDESFYLSNCVPQTANLNRGEWNKLEQQIRRWRDQKGQLWILTGPAFEKNRAVETIGDGVAVPHLCWKVVVDELPSGELAVAGFLMPNADQVPAWKTTQVSLDDIEAKTGLDLLAGLPDAEEKALEKGIDKTNWK
jgi:endonuclease G